MISPEEYGTFVTDALRRYHYERCTDHPEEENPYLNSDLCREIQKELDDEMKMVDLDLKLAAIDAALDKLNKHFVKMAVIETVLLVILVALVLFRIAQL